MLKQYFTRTSLLILLISNVFIVTVNAEEVTKAQIKGLDEQVQDIKTDVLQLTDDLTRLEEKLLFPSNTQSSIFISLQENDDFVLDSVQIKMDEKIVAHYLYSYKELEALKSGGVQRIYTGNIKTGKHRLVANFIGRAKTGKAYQKSASYTLTKAVKPSFVEMQIQGDSASDKTITFKDW